MKKETTAEKIDRYIRISQTPLGIRYRDHVKLYNDRKLSALEFCYICDQITMKHQRCGFKTLQDVLNETTTKGV